MKWQATRLGKAAASGKFHPVMEVVRGAKRAGFLDSPSEGIVLEGRGPAVGAGDDRLRQAVLEVPGVGFAAGVPNQEKSVRKFASWLRN